MEGVYRKVQKIGYSTLSVSLPLKWARKSGLKPGDVVYLEPENDGSLRLLPSNLKPREGIEKFICNADLCDEPKMLERVIVGVYILGCDVISIISSGRMHSEHIEEVRGISRRLIGLGIVEATTDSITLQCSIDPKKFHLDMLLRRLSVLSLTIVKEALQALQELNVPLAKEAIRREEEADQVYLLAMRLLIYAQKRKDVALEIGITDCLQILNFGLILRYLELISDHAEEMAYRVIELLQKYEDKLSKGIVERLNNLNDLAYDLVQKAVDSFFISDIKIANSLIEMKTFMDLERERLMDELPEIPHLRSIYLNINRIADNGARIALIAINNALEKGKNNICSKQWQTSLK